MRAWAPAAGAQDEVRVLGEVEMSGVTGGKPLGVQSEGKGSDACMDLKV